MPALNPETVEFYLTLLQYGGVITGLQRRAMLSKVSTLPYGVTLSTATQYIRDSILKEK